MPAVVHPATRKILNAVMRELPQSLLLSGEAGVGLMTIAKELAGKNLAGEIHPQDAKEKTDDENGTVTVEMIRRLYEQTRAKHAQRHIIIIDNADRMSRGAANAFLKLLEEPNERIYFILTSHKPQNLLPTVRSRLQHIPISPITPEQTADFISALGITDRTKISQLQFIAAGLPAELTRLTTNDEHFAKRAEIIGDARDLLQGNTYKKLLVIQKYKSDRAGALQLIDGTINILRRTLSANPQQALIRQLDQLSDTKEHIAANHNIALQLTQFVL